MKILMIIMFFLLQFGFSSEAFATMHHEYGLLCNTCSTQSDFVTFAVNHTPHLIGESDTTIANYDTNVIYVVSLEWEPENSVWYYDINNVSLGSQDLVNSFIAAKSLFGGHAHVFVQPPTNGEVELYGSYSGSELAAVNNAIVATTAVTDSIYAAIFWQALLQREGQYPIIVFVFYNGDTAQYLVENPGQAALCCSYIDGSAKDKDGNPLDAPPTNPSHLGITASGEPRPGVNNFDYSSLAGSYTCSFLVDGNDHVVGFIGCARNF